MNHDPTTRNVCYAYGFVGKEKGNINLMGQQAMFITKIMDLVVLLIVLTNTISYILLSCQDFHLHCMALISSLGATTSTCIVWLYSSIPGKGLDITYANYIFLKINAFSITPFLFIFCNQRLPCVYISFRHYEIITIFFHHSDCGYKFIEKLITRSSNSTKLVSSILPFYHRCLTTVVQLTSMIGRLVTTHFSNLDEVVTLLKVSTSILITKCKASSRWPKSYQRSISSCNTCNYYTPYDHISLRHSSLFVSIFCMHIYCPCFPLQIFLWLVIYRTNQFILPPPFLSSISNSFHLVIL